MGDNIGPFTDVPAPDMYTDAQTMAWIYDSYDRLHPGENNLPVVTGKPLELGGSEGRNEATGRGCVYCAERFLAPGGLARTQRALRGPSGHPGLRGDGRGGGTAAPGAGGPRDRDQRLPGGILAENGDNLDLAAVAAHRADAGTVVGLPGSRSITNADLLALPCDILLPAALGGQIHGGNAHRMRARLIVEGANRPVTPAADDILGAQGVLVLPDILANAGRVTVSYSGSRCSTRDGAIRRHLEQDLG